MRQSRMWMTEWISFQKKRDWLIKYCKCSLLGCQRFLVRLSLAFHFYGILVCLRFLRYFGLFITLGFVIIIYKMRFFFFFFLLGAVSRIGCWSFLLDGHSIWQIGKTRGQGRSCSFIQETCNGPWESWGWGSSVEFIIINIEIVFYVNWHHESFSFCGFSSFLLPVISLEHRWAVIFCRFQSQFEMMYLWLKNLVNRVGPFIAMALVAQRGSEIFA